MTTWCEWHGHVDFLPNNNSPGTEIYKKSKTPLNVPHCMFSVINAKPMISE